VNSSRFAVTIGWILRVGVLLSSLIVLVGGVMNLSRGWSLPVDYSRFNGEPAGLRGVRGVWAGASGLHSEAVIQLGLLVLIATPIARVVFCVIEFLRERDWTYSAITLVVLGLLSYSIVAIR